MGQRQCIVCNRLVPQGYEQDHLNANHLGPHEWWFNGRKFCTRAPSMAVHEIKALADSSPEYQFFQEREGDRAIYYADAESVDLTQRPHFFAVPPATMFG